MSLGTGWSHYWDGRFGIAAPHREFVLVQLLELKSETRPCCLRLPSGALGNFNVFLFQCSLMFEPSGWSLPEFRFWQGGLRCVSAKSFGSEAGTAVRNATLLPGAATGDPRKASFEPRRSDLRCSDLCILTFRCIARLTTNWVGRDCRMDVFRLNVAAPSGLPCCGCMCAHCSQTGGLYVACSCILSDVGPSRAPRSFVWVSTQAVVMY